MKKNIIIGILTIVSIASLVYGYTQHQRVKEFQVLATQNANLAKQYAEQARHAMEEAEQQRKMAEEHLAIAEMQRMKSEEKLKELQKK